MPELNFDELLRPENDLERAFLRDPEFRKGLMWGTPRYGHPEGAIWRHVQEVCENIDRLPISGEDRRKLRLVTFVHDTFKNVEDKSNPRDWTKHHSIYARNFLANYVDDDLLLNLVELHDEAYYVWRLRHLYQRIGDADVRLRSLRERMGDYWQLYYLFFKSDTSTGDKNPSPLVWFEEVVKDIEVVEFL